MYKIAILGVENSHADAFLKFVKEGHYPDIEIVGIYSDEPEAVKKLNEEFGVAIMDNYDSLAGKVDGIMVTARHGDNHYKYAKPYIKYGIPMFIDKPTTCSDEEAVEFMNIVKEKGILLCGGSTCTSVKETKELAAAVKENKLGILRGGSIACPVFSDSPYGGFYFYAQHLVEIMTTVFGYDVKTVSARRTSNAVLFTANYDSYSVQGAFQEKTGYYNVSVYGADNAESRCFTVVQDDFRVEMDDMLNILNGGKMRKSYEQLAAPVFIMNTVLRAVESGKEEKIPEYKI